MPDTPVRDLAVEVAGDVLGADPPPPERVEVVRQGVQQGYVHRAGWEVGVLDGVTEALQGLNRFTVTTELEDTSVALRCNHQPCASSMWWGRAVASQDGSEPYTETLPDPLTLDTLVAAARRHLAAEHSGSTPPPVT